MSETTPNVGRIVHYVSFGTPGGEYTQQCRAAKVTEVGGAWIDEKIEPHPTDPNVRLVTQRRDPLAVGLEISNPTGLFFNRAIQYDGGTGEADWSCDGKHHAGGTWHWAVRL